MGNYDKREKLVIFCARSTSRSREKNKKRRSHSESMRKVVYPIVKITRLGQTWFVCLRNSRGAQRYMGFFSWWCFSDADWLGRQIPITWIPEVQVELCSVYLSLWSASAILDCTWQTKCSWSLVQFEDYTSSFFLSFIAFPFFLLYIRTMFTYASGILAYAVTWIVLGQNSGDGLSPDSWKDFTVRPMTYSK